MSNNDSKTLLLGELRSEFEKVYLASDSLDTKLHNLLNFNSLIVSFAATIQISMLQERVGITFWQILGFAVLLYLCNFLVIILGLNPTTYTFAIKSTRRNVEQQYFKLTESEMTNQLIANYICALGDATKANRVKIMAVRIADCLLIAIVVLLFLAVPSGLLNPKPTLFEFFHIK